MTTSTFPVYTKKSGSLCRLSEERMLGAAVMKRENKKIKKHQFLSALLLMSESAVYFMLTCQCKTVISSQWWDCDTTWTTESRSVWKWTRTSIWSLLMTWSAASISSPVSAKSYWISDSSLIRLAQKSLQLLLNVNHTLQAMKSKSIWVDKNKENVEYDKNLWLEQQ